MAAANAPSYDDWMSWVATTPAPKDDLDYFNSVPWTKAYLNQQPLFKPVSTPSRAISQSTSDNSFFAKTLKGPSVISHWLLMMRRDFVTPSELPKGSIQNAETSKVIKTRSTEQTDCVLLLHLEKDLDGFAGTAHGGLLCAIVDESLSVCVEFHRQLISRSRAPLYTAYLNTKFLAPVKTPGDVVVKSWLDKREGRKWLMKAQICDATESVLFEAEGLWISAKEGAI